MGKRSLPVSGAHRPGAMGKRSLPVNGARPANLLRHHPHTNRRRQLIACLVIHCIANALFLCALWGYVARVVAIIRGGTFMSLIRVSMLLSLICALGACSSSDSDSAGAGKCGVAGGSTCHACVEASCCNELTACSKNAACASAYKDFETCATTKGLSSCSFSAVMNSGPEGKPLAVCQDTNCYKQCGGT
jgi:hypothetical protein